MKYSIVDGIFGFLQMVTLGAALVAAASVYAAGQRYDLVSVMPRATIVFDRATGEAFQSEPLPMFSERRDQP